MAPLYSLPPADASGGGLQEQGHGTGFPLNRLAGQVVRSL